MFRRFTRPSCKVQLWSALMLLGTTFFAQRQVMRSTAHSHIEEYLKHLEKIELVGEKIRQERIDSGALWLGVLHKNVSTDRWVAPHSPSAASGLGQGRISIDSIPVGADSQYYLALELHECNPDLDACSSGGSFRLTTASGESLFSGELGMLLMDPEKQSYYSLLWGEAADSLTHEQRQDLLNEIAGGSDQPTAATFYENLTQAYLYSNHREGPGKEQALRLWRNVLKAINASS